MLQLLDAVFTQPRPIAIFLLMRESGPFANVRFRAASGTWAHLVANMGNVESGQRATLRGSV